jgi:hypothetical protein
MKGSEGPGLSVGSVGQSPPATVVAWLPAWTRGAKAPFGPGSRKLRRHGGLVLREGDNGWPAFLGPRWRFPYSICLITHTFPVRFESDRSSLGLVRVKPGHRGRPKPLPNLNWWYPGGACASARARTPGNLFARASWRFRCLRDCLTSPCSSGRGRSKGSD